MRKSLVIGRFFFGLFRNLTEIKFFPFIEIKFYSILANSYSS